MKMLRITLEGKTYDVTVEVLDDSVAALPHTSHAPATSTPVPPPANPAHTVPVDQDCRVVVSPMAGKVFKCLVNPGDVVLVNQELIVLDAMKMETPVVAPVAGTVRAVLVKEGDAVDEGYSLIQLDGPPLLR